MNHKFKTWGTILSTMASGLLLLANNESVGVAIQRQWIKVLRDVANEMERELNGTTIESEG